MHRVYLPREKLANVVWKELQSMTLSQWETLQEKPPQVPQHPLSTAGGCNRSALILLSRSFASASVTSGEAFCRCYTAKILHLNWAYFTKSGLLSR